MRPLRGMGWGCAVLLLGTGAGSVQAAWDNVFQVTCFHRQPRTTASYYYAAAAPSAGCPQPACQSCYVQRCYYQPVTTYQTRTYYEPVTTYKTSYYYEPVTKYSYSSYYDPCTCSYQQVACPTTCYQLRSQTCPVQSWVQRCCSVPVTSYQQAFYWEPVTNCCTPTSNGGVAALPQQECATQPPAGVTQPPAGAGVRPPTGGGVGVTETPGSGRSEPIPNQNFQDNMPPAGSSSYRQLPPRGTAPGRQTTPTPPPTVKMDRIAAAPAGKVEGQVVRGDLPVAGAHVLFVSADRRQPRQTTATDRDGQFRATLTSGGWLVYVQAPEGKPVFQRKIDVRENETRSVNLVSR